MAAFHLGRGFQMEHKSTGLRRGWPYILMILPTFLLLGAVTFYPAFYNIWLSFRNESLRTITSSFVGLANYRRVLSDPFFWGALGRTLIYMAGSLVLRVVLGLALALLLNIPQRGRSVVRTAILLPWVLSEVIVTAMWLWILDHRTGLLNALFATVKLGPYGWLVYPGMAMGTIIMVSLWKNLAFSFLLLFAALQQIPVDLYDSGKIDGCSSAGLIRHITLPLIRPTLTIVTIMVSISAFGQFSLVYSLTGGGPLRSTELVGLYMYQQAFTFLDIGYGSAIAMVIFLINIALSLVYYYALRSESLY